MRAKASHEQRTVLHRLYERGEHTLGQVIEDWLGHPGVTDGLTKMVQRAAKTKGRLDKNVELLLHLLNLPSRADYHKLLMKIEHLQGSMVNLSIKLDRVLAAQEQPKKKPKR
jgi:hypothetical protein